MFNPDFARLEILVSDINDNHPVFLKPRYDAVVVENAVVGTTVLKVSAKDSDTVRCCN